MMQVERREMVSLWMAYGMLSDMKIGDVGEMISSGVSKSLRWQKWSAVMIKIGGGKTKRPGRRLFRYRVLMPPFRSL